MGLRAVVVESYRVTLPPVAASVLGGLFAGAVLGGMRAELTAVPGLLVLVPALLATRGNVYGSLGARLATGLHQGLIEPRIGTDDRRLWTAIAAAVSNGILTSLFAAAATVAILSTLGRRVATLETLLAVAAVAGVLSGIALTGAVVSVAFVGYRRGLDPDTLVGPIVTTTGDVFGMAFLLVAARVVLAAGGGP